MEISTNEAHLNSKFNPSQHFKKIESKGKKIRELEQADRRYIFCHLKDYY